MKRAVTLLIVILGAAPAFGQGRLPDILPPDTPFMLEFRQIGTYEQWTRQTALGRIWAEPETQVFVEGLRKTVADAIAGQRRRGPDPFMMLGLEPEDFLGIEIKSAGVAMLGFTETEVPDVLMHVEIGKGQEKIAKILASLRNAYGMFVGVPFTEEKIGEASLFHAILGPVEIAHMQVDGHLLLATGRQHVKSALAMLKGARKANLRGTRRFQDTLATMEVKEYQTLAYLDAERLLAVLRPVMHKAEVVNMDAWLGIFGLDAVESMAMADVPAGANLRTEFALRIRERRGIFSLIQSAPTAEPFLRLMPADALASGSERVDLERFHREFLAAAEAAGAKVQSYRAILRKYKEVLGFDFETDFLGSLGDEWGMYVGGTPGGALIPDMVLLCSVKDRAKLEACIKAMVTRYPDVVKMHGGEKNAARLRHRRTKFAGRTIDLLELSQRNGDPIPIAPAWTLGDGYIAVSLWPHALKHLLSNRPSLRGNEALANLRRHAPKGGTSYGYFDLPRAWIFLYNTAVPVLQGVQGAINRELAPLGAKISLHDLPRAEVFAKHLTPALGYTKSTDDSIRTGYVSSCGLSLVSAGMAAAGVMAFTLIEADERDMREARREMRMRVRIRELEAEIAELEQARAQDRKRYAARIEELAKQLAELRKLMDELK